MNRPRILVITGGHLCRNPRVVKEADTLGRAGYDVTVLGVRNHPPSETHDATLRQGAAFRHVAIEGLTGWAARQRRLQSALARHLVRRFRWSTPLAFGPARALLARARRLPAELTIVHTEAPMWAGTRLLADGRRVAVDFEDWHAEDLLAADRANRPQALLVDIERTLMQRAAYVSTTSQALADALHARYGGHRPAVIANSFPLQPDPRDGEPGDPPAFFWFSQTIGPGRGLESFIAAWAQTKQPSRLVLLGEPRSGFVDELLRPVPESRRNAIEWRPLVPPAELPAVIAQHDIGLALEVREILNRDLTVTNKILQYLNAGLAVVATATAGQREVLAQGPEAGLLVESNDPTALAAVLDEMLADRARLARCQRAARKLAERRFCWEREVPNLLTLVRNALEQDSQ